MSIVLDKVTYKYSFGTSFETTALDSVSLTINDGEFISIIGHTGSGKSTLIQHMNGLLLPSSGKVYYNGKDISEKDFDLKELRTCVGMVFQYPEHQLFEATIFDDVKFGPKNQGLSDKEASLRAYEALEGVGFPKDLFTQAPFNLSGGQKRLAAIAGVLAMKPAVIILDEPTAGLDPSGKREIFEILHRLHESGRTVILVSHNMDDVAKSERILVLNDGKLIGDGTPREVFSHVQTLESIGLALPETSYIMRDLKENGFDVPDIALTEDEVTGAILSSLKRGGYA